MTDERLEDPPESVRGNLDDAAWFLYRSSYARALALYRAAESRHPAASPEETAHRVARAAVVNRFGRG